MKKVLLKISQKSQENTCATVSFLLKLQASGQALVQVFSWEFFKNFNDTLMEELALYSKIHWKTRLDASDVFHMFTQLSSFNSIIVQMPEKRVIHQAYSKNEWLLLSVNFTANLELVFVLTFENPFS